MKTPPPTDEQERIRLEGLRRLARIIARHALAHPDRYERREREAPAAGEGRSREDGAA